MKAVLLFDCKLKRFQKSKNSFCANNYFQSKLETFQLIRDMLKKHFIF